MDTRFGYGQINANREGNKNLDPKWWLPIGYERIYAYGYTQVKISHGAHCKNWKSKHSVIWEQAHGKIPEGHVIIFADGNKRNFDLDNLLLVSKAERAAMNSLGLIFPDKELTETGKAVAGLKLLINRRERDVKKSKSSRT
jgi:hypothetical protein